MPTSKEVNAIIRQSLGLPPLPDVKQTMPVEGHVCEFPLWSFSKKRSNLTKLRITYDDGSYVQIDAPKGFPGITSPGYLDVLLYYGQKDLFQERFVEMSAYSILKRLNLDPTNGGCYQDFVQDMRRSAALLVETDRFIDPLTRKRSYTYLFHILDSVMLAKYRQSISRFYFNEIFLQSFRSGYFRRLDFDFCLYLDRQREPLARFLYGHLAKRVGDKSVYARELTGFLNDVGLGHMTRLPTKYRNERLKRVVFPALDLLKGEALSHYEVDGNGNLVFFPKAKL